MTREEAIKSIEDIRLKFLGQYGEETVISIPIDGDDMQAFDMAIKALEQEATVINEIPKDYKYDTETKDFLVYRHKYTGDEIHIEKPIPLYRLEQEPYFWEKCPYYEPDIMFDEKDEYDMGKCTYKQEPCEDAISRQMVKRLLEDRFMELQKRHDDKRYETNYCLNTILELPSVKPQEQKTGRWITWKEAGNEITSETRFECSVCHDSAQTLCNGLDLLSPYCPNCGAKMESEGKECLD